MDVSWKFIPINIDNAQWASFELKRWTKNLQFWNLNVDMLFWVSPNSANFFNFWIAESSIFVKKKSKILASREVWWNCQYITPQRLDQRINLQMEKCLAFFITSTGNKCPVHVVQTSSSLVPSWYDFGKMTSKSHWYWTWQNFWLATY